MSDATVDKLQPYVVEQTIDGKLIAFNIRAENRPTAVAEVQRYIKQHEGAVWPEFENLHAYYKKQAANSFGIVGWSIYSVETVQL